MRGNRMSMVFKSSIAAILICVCCRPAAAAAGETPGADAMLAIRLSEMATASLSGTATDAHWRQCAALMEAAAKADASQARYWRLLADARIHLGQDKEALEALTGFRRLEPRDQFAQLQ